MNQLSVIQPQELVRQSTDIAGLCKEIVLKSVSNINGKKYVKVEGWQAIAIAHGCTASAHSVEKIEGGIRAIGEVKRMADGNVISSAEGFVGDDEAKWASGAEYARRAMAQTRAISRACRSAFAHVVVLMDAGLSTTPAEEVPHGGFDNHEATARQDRREREASEKPTGLKQNDWRNIECTFGKKGGPLRGKKLGDLNPSNLKYLADRFLADGAQVDDKDRKMVAGLAMWQAETTANPNDRIVDGAKGKSEFPKREELAAALDWERPEITPADFIAAMKGAGQIPADAAGFQAMSEETAAKFIDDFENCVVIVRQWQEAQR